MSGHTAGPLIVGAHFAERLGGRTYIPILRPGNDPVPVAVVHRDVDGYGRDEGEATAAFIVTAYNSHADLVKALEDTERHLAFQHKWLSCQFDAMGRTRDEGTVGADTWEQIEATYALWTQVKRALATLTARKVG